VGALRSADSRRNLQRVPELVGVPGGHKKFSNQDDGTGFVEAWIDRKPITFSTCDCTRLSMQTMHSTQPQLGFYLTSYRAHGFLAVAELYLDGARVGTTRASVELE